VIESPVPDAPPRLDDFFGAEQRSLARIRLDGIIGLGGFMLLTSGLHWERTNRRRRDDGG
jgi:hypothetical protein